MVGFIVARLTAEGEEFSVKVYGSRLLPLQNNHPNLTSKGQDITNETNNNSQSHPFLTFLPKCYNKFK